MNINLTILGQAISFALFVLFCMKYVWPPLTNILRERREAIIDGLEKAARAEEACALLQEGIRVRVLRLQPQSAQIHVAR